MMWRSRTLARLALFGALSLGPSLDGPALAAEAGEESEESLEQRIKILERKAEIAAEEAATKAKEAVTAGAGKDGFFLRSADGSWQFKLRGYIQMDGRFFEDDERAAALDTFVLRRVRPLFEGTVGKIFDFRIMPDFGAGAATLFDAYLDARFSPKATLRAGKFKPPVGLERLQGATDILFVERALPTNLVPNRDLGLELRGDFGGGRLSYFVGVFNGVADGTNLPDLDTNDGKEVAARIFANPFKKSDVLALQGLGLGISTSHGRNEGTLIATGLSSYRSASQLPFFSYRSDTPATDAGTVVAAGWKRRLSPQAYYYVGRFGAITEYVLSSHEVAIGGVEETLEHEAWQLSVSFMLTPDKASFRSVSPKKPFDLASDTFGAFEIALRVEGLEVDEDAFPVFANPATSASEAQAWGAGVNWYLSRNVKFMLDYEQTSFEGGSATGDREAERILFNRFQIAF